jgi:hypothetical protein
MVPTQVVVWSRPQFARIDVQSALPDASSNRPVPPVNTIEYVATQGGGKRCETPSTISK